MSEPVAEHPAAPAPEGAPAETTAPGPVTATEETDGFGLFADRSVVAMRVDGELRDLAARVQPGTVVEPVTIDSPDGLAILRHSAAHVLAQAVQQINPEARLGIGPPITDGFYYDFDVARALHARGPQGARRRRWSGSSARASASCAASSPRRRRARSSPTSPTSSSSSGSRAAASEGADGESVEVGGAELTIYDNVDPQDGRGPLEGPVPRPAPAQHAHDRQRLRPHARRRRLLARVGEEPAAAAHLRHRLADEGRAARVPGAARGGRQARPPQARRRARPVLASPTRSARASRSSTPRAASSAPRSRTTSRKRHRRGRLRARLLAAHHQGAACSRPAATCSGTRTACSRRCTSTRSATTTATSREQGAELLPEADELPVPQPDLPRARPQLPRAAAAARRVRHRLPLREERHALTGSPACAGSRRTTRTSTSRPIRSRPRWRASCSSCSRPCAATASTTSTSSSRRRTRRSTSATTRSGIRRPTRCARSRSNPGSSSCPIPGGAAFYGPKISVQARDAIGRTWQLSTVQLDFNQPERFDLRVHGHRRHAPAAGHDPPRAARLDRALLRHPARALRGRLPGVARSRAGRRHPRRGGVRRATSRRSSPSCARRACARTSTAPTTACRRRSAPTPRARCRTCCIAGAEDVANGAVELPLPRRHPGQRGARRRGRRAHPSTIASRSAEL